MKTPLLKPDRVTPDLPKPDLPKPDLLRPDLSGAAAVLFDLDGTLLDSAPDLAAALEALCAEEGIAPPPYAAVREVVSRGAGAMLGKAFPTAGEDALAALMPRFLKRYGDTGIRHTRPFEGVVELLELLESCHVPWGIVTNKAAFLTDPIVRVLGWDARAAAVVCGDTLEVKKPDPGPLLHACRLTGVQAVDVVMVGDDLRDVQAGRAAGMRTVAARWGYLDGGDPETWDADVVAASPLDLPGLLALRPS